MKLIAAHWIQPSNPTEVAMQNGKNANPVANPTAAQYGKLADAKAVAAMKAYWTARLDALKKMLEGG